MTSTGWNQESHPLNVRWDGSGIWEGFIPNIGKGTLYKYCIQTPQGDRIEKGDPFARFWEIPPAQPPSSGIFPTNGRIAIGWRNANRRVASHSPIPCTRCTWVPGVSSTTTVVRSVTGNGQGSGRLYCRCRLYTRGVSATNGTSIFPFLGLPGYWILCTPLGLDNPRTSCFSSMHCTRRVLGYW